MFECTSVFLSLCVDVCGPLHVIESEDDAGNYCKIGLWIIMSVIFSVNYTHLNKSAASTS